MIADQSLSAFNTLALDARAEWFAAPGTAEELISELVEARERKLRVMLLGEGSNVVLVDDIPGLVLQPAITGVEVLLDKPDSVLIAASAGEHFDNLVAWSLEQGYQGLENLSLIPGSVGAAPYQNIGAYGMELSDRLVWVEAIQISNGKVQRLLNAHCDFRYRDSLFKSRLPGAFAITRVCLRLNKQAAAPSLTLHYGDLRERFAALPQAEQNAFGLRELVCALRTSKLPDPAVLPNVGSFFKNPVVATAVAESLKQQHPDLPVYPQTGETCKLAAGWLIEQAGFKGKRVGAVGMHDRQALVLVNHGGATGQDVLAFAATVREAVARRFGVLLEQEPVCFPEKV
jgi:UDP-N-acetylmuramate dehydrogenase